MTETISVTHGSEHISVLDLLYVLKWHTEIEKRKTDFHIIDFPNFGFWKIPFCECEAKCSISIFSFPIIVIYKMIASL